MRVLVYIAGNPRISAPKSAEVRAERYRAHAAECAAFARRALNRDDGAILKDMATVWRRLAELVERFELA
jgi:hypothetical protein